MDEWSRGHLAYPDTDHAYQSNITYKNILLSPQFTHTNFKKLNTVLRFINLEVLY